MRVKFDKLNSSPLLKLNNFEVPFASITVSEDLFVTPTIVFLPEPTVPIDPFTKSFSVIT